MQKFLTTVYHMNKNQMITILRWTARTWSIAAIAFISVLFLGHMFGPSGLGTFSGFTELLQALFFPAGVYIGLNMAFKWEGPGGLLTIGSLVAFYLLRMMVHGKPDLTLVSRLTDSPAPGFCFCFAGPSPGIRPPMRQANL